MLSNVGLYCLLFTQIIFLRETYGVNTIAESKIIPITTGLSWEFNSTILANDKVVVNTTLQNEAVFALVQVHSYLYNISISNDLEESQFGTNTGLIMYPNFNTIVFSIYNPNKIPVNVLGFITPYDEHACIAGGCVPSNETIRPLINLEVTNNLIELSAQSALEVFIANQTCSTSSIKYRLFYMYTSEKDFTMTTYFEGIRTMVYSEKMKNEASEYKLPIKQHNGKINILFANYAGTGILFHLSAEGENGSSMYVISHTFGCNYTSDKDSCVYLVNTLCRVGVVVLCVAGLVLCFCGYEWKGFELGIMIFILTSIITYTVIYTLQSSKESVLTSLVTGAAVSCIIVLYLPYSIFLHTYHIFTFSVFGLLASSCILFFTKVGNCPALKQEEVYWASFFIISLSVFLLMYANSACSHYFTTGFIGSFMAVLTIDYFAGSSLKFIYFDNIRRLSVQKFTSSHISPPIQTPDVVLSVVWFTLAFSCVAYQYFGQILYCHRDINDTESDAAEVGHSSNPREFIDAQSEVTYATFDDTLPLIDPDPSQCSFYCSQD